MTWHTYCYPNLTRPLQLPFFLVFWFLLFCHLFHPLLHLLQSLALPSPPHHLHNLLPLCPHHPLVPFFFCPFCFCFSFHLILPSLRRFSGGKKKFKNMNSPFPSSKNSNFQDEAKCKTFLTKMSLWVLLEENKKRQDATERTLRRRGCGTD